MKNPEGLCLCGCGRKTNIATADHRRSGYTPGEPLRFIHGHHRRVQPQSAETRRKIAEANSGPKSSRWRGGRYVQGNGYIMVWLPPDHPLRGMAHTRDPYVLEHRLVMAEHLGRPLAADEEVHHIDGDRQNNRLENLELLGKSAHCRVTNATVRVADVERIAALLETHTPAEAAAIVSGENLARYQRR